MAVCVACSCVDISSALDFVQWWLLELVFGLPSPPELLRSVVRLPSHADVWVGRATNVVAVVSGQGLRGGCGGWPVED